jgi:hypothetical protein
MLDEYAMRVVSAFLAAVFVVFAFGLFQSAIVEARRASAEEAADCAMQIRSACDGWEPDEEAAIQRALQAQSAVY